MRVRCAHVAVAGLGNVGLPSASSEASSIWRAARRDQEDTTGKTDIALDPFSPSARSNVGYVLKTCQGPMATFALAICLVASLSAGPSFLLARIEAPQRDWLHRYDAAAHPAQLSRFRGGRLAGSS